MFAHNGYWLHPANCLLGFFNEIVTEIGVPEVEERLMAAIEKELELTGLIAARAGAEMADPTQA